MKTINKPVKNRYMKTNISSLRPIKVANEVINRVRQGKRINMQEIQLANGYTKSSARAMKATQAKAYQETINPVIKQMASLRDKTLRALHNKDLDDTKVFDLNLLLKNLNHDLQLLEGKSTSNHAHVNTVVVYGSDDFLALQMNNKLSINGDIGDNESK